MRELCDQLSKGLSVRNIKNIWAKTQDQIFENEIRPPVKNLDELPFPDRGIFSSKRQKQYKASIIASRGCAYSCPYCCASEINNATLHEVKSFRVRSVPNVIEELQQIKREENGKTNRSVVFTTVSKKLPGVYRQRQKLAMSFQGGIKCWAIINDDIVDIEYGLGDMTAIRSTIDQHFVLIRFNRENALVYENFFFHKYIPSNNKQIKPTHLEIQQVSCQTDENQAQKHIMATLLWFFSRFFSLNTKKAGLLITKDK